MILQDHTDFYVQDELGWAKDEVGRHEKAILDVQGRDESDSLQNP